MIGGSQSKIRIFGGNDKYPTIPAMVRDVWFLLFDGFQLLDAAAPLQVLATANDERRLIGGTPLYRTSLRALSPGLHRSSSGVSLLAEGLPARLRRPLHTVVVPGGPGAWAGGACASAAQPLAVWLRQAQSRVERLASVCTGAFVLGEAGLLTGRQVVTHWTACSALQDAFADVRVQPDAIYSRDGPCWTSAGVTAGIDLALGMVEEDAGHALAMRVAKRLVVFYKRPGGQSQFSSELLAQSAGDDRIARLHTWLVEHLREPLNVSRLAERLSMSPRTFARFYVRQTGGTPAHAVDRLRVERACRQIEAQLGSIKSVAHSCGFSSEEVMRRAFWRHLRVSPMEYRERFSVGSDPAFKRGADR